jgi:hypothetical protein
MSYEIEQNDHQTNNITYWFFYKIQNYRTVNLNFSKKDIVDVFYISNLIFNYIYYFAASYNFFGSFVNLIPSLFFQILLEEDVRNFCLKNILYIFIILFSVFSNFSKISKFCIYFFGCLISWVAKFTFYLFVWSVKLFFRILNFILFFLLDLLLKFGSLLIIPNKWQSIIKFHIVFTIIKDVRKIFLKLIIKALKNIHILNKLNLGTLFVCIFSKLLNNIIFFCYYLNNFFFILFNPSYNIRKLREFYSVRKTSSDFFGKLLEKNKIKNDDKLKISRKNYEKIHRFNNEQQFLDVIKQPLENQKYNFR